MHSSDPEDDRKPTRERAGRFQQGWLIARLEWRAGRLRGNQNLAVDTSLVGGRRTSAGRCLASGQVG